jgi:hypothetical protein
MNDAKARPRPRLLRRQEVLESIGKISMRTLERMIQRGQFPEPVQWAGRVPLFDADVFESWLRGDWRSGPKTAKAKAKPRCKPAGAGL